MHPPIIHIGYHKTATTWFQKIYYPAVRNFVYVDRRRVKAAFLTRTPFDFDPEEARQILDLDQHLPPILCEEELSGYLHNGGMGGYLSAEMARRLKAVFPDARIVIFIRSQPAMIAAAYQQYIRGGGTYSVKRYLFSSQYLHGASADGYKIPRFSFAHFEYDRLIAHYDMLFGPENVFVTPYERFARDPAGALAEHERTLGIETGGIVPTSRRVNQSYGAALIPFARLLNLFTYRTVNDKRTLFHIPGWYTRRRKILEALNRTRIFGPPPAPEKLLGEDAVKWIESFYAQSNQRLEKSRAMGLKEWGYPVGSDEPLPLPLDRKTTDWRNA